MNAENAVHFPGILILGSENRGLCPHAPTFFSFLDARKEGKRKSRSLPRPGKLAGYMMEIENVMRFQIIRSLYLENVPRFRHSSSLKWYSVGRIHLAYTFFSCLDTRKESKRKSRPLPRPGKLSGYMRFSVMYLANFAGGRSRLLLIEEKKQKKIKASGTPANLAWYVICT